MTDHGLRYFDDYVPETTHDCGSVSFSQAEIISFATQFDPQPFHVDPEAAAHGPFGGLVASGWHTAALVMRQLVDHYLSAEASLGSRVWTRSAGPARSGRGTRSVSGPPYWRPAARRASRIAAS